MARHPNSDKAHRHNGYKGYVHRTALAASEIMRSDTVTARGKSLAGRIWDLSNELRIELDTIVIDRKKNHAATP